MDYARSIVAFLLPLALAVVMALAAPGIGRASVENDVTGFVWNGIGESDDVAISPDGAHAYFADDDIGVFDRDGTDGRLRLVATQTDIGPSGFSLRAGSLVLSPGGEHLYAAQYNGVDEQVAAYARSGISGELTLLGSASGPDLDGRRIRISPDGLDLYVVSGGFGGTVSVYRRDAGTGLVAFTQSVAEGVGGTVGMQNDPTEAQVSPDGAHVYVSADDRVLVFARDPATGVLTWVETQQEGQLGVSGLEEAESLAVSADGANVYVASKDAVAVFQRNPGTGALTYLEKQTNGVGGVTDLGQGERVLVSSDGAFVYVAGRTARSVVVFARNGATGALGFVESHPAVLRDSSYSSAIATSPGDGHVYTGSGYVFDRDAGTGALTRAHFPFLDPTAVTVSADGAHVYALTRIHEALFVFERDPVSGELTSVETLVEGEGGISGLDEAWDVFVSPDGLTVHVTDEEGALTSYLRDVVSGKLTMVDQEMSGVGGLPTPWSPHRLAMSPDSAFVYVRSRKELTVFARNAGTGELTFVETHAQADNYAAGLALDPAGDHVYAGYAVFARNAVSGELTHVEDVGNLSVASIQVSPDGQYVYRARGGSLDVFTRNPTTGQLSVLQELGDDIGGVSFFVGGVNRADIIVSPDGAYLHDGANSFVRKPDGTLAYVDSEPLGNASLAFDPTGAHLYAASYGWPGMSILEPGFGCSPTPVAGCRDGLRAKVTIKDSVLDLKDKMVLKLLDVDSTTLAEFEPMVEEHVALCGYDESGVPALVLDALAPAGGDCGPDNASSEKPCWTATNKVVKYKDRWYSPDGLQSIVAKASDDDRAKIIVKGARSNLQPPPLPLGLPFRMQLQSAKGLCWEVVFPTAKKNDVATFKAQIP